MRTNPTPAQEYPLGEVLDLLREWWALNHAFETASRRMLSRLGLTAQQRFVIRVLGRYPGIAPGQIARILHLDPGSISATIHRLEEVGLLERRRAAKDGRSVTLHLTARGRRIDKSDPATVEGALERVLAALPEAKVKSVRTFLSTFVRELHPDEAGQSAPPDPDAETTPAPPRARRARRPAVRP